MFRIILIKHVLKEWIISPLTLYSGKRLFRQDWESKDCDPKKEGIVTLMLQKNVINWVYIKPL